MIDDDASKFERIYLYLNTFFRFIEMFKYVKLMQLFVCCQLMLFCISSNGNGIQIKPINESLNIANINHIDLYKKNLSIAIDLESSHFGKKFDS